MPARVWLWGFVPLLIAAVLGNPRLQLRSPGASYHVRPVQRLPNGEWVTVKDVSLSYGSRVVYHNTSYGKGTNISRSGDSKGAHLLNALNKVCG